MLLSLQFKLPLSKLTAFYDLNIFFYRNQADFYLTHHQNTSYHAYIFVLSFVNIGHYANLFSKLCIWFIYRSLCSLKMLSEEKKIAQIKV